MYCDMCYGAEFANIIALAQRFIFKHDLANFVWEEHRKSSMPYRYSCSGGCAAQSPPECCAGRQLERGVQEPVKAPVKPLASPLDSVRLVALMYEVRPTPDSLFGDVPDLDSRKAAEIAKDKGQVEKP